MPLNRIVRCLSSKNRIEDSHFIEPPLPAATATAQALYDARLDLEVALAMLYWLIPDHGQPWIHMRQGDDTRQWYMVTNKDDMRYIQRWAGPMANGCGIYTNFLSILCFYNLIGADWGTYDRPGGPRRPAATVKATAEAHAQPPLALPRPSEFGGVGHPHTLPLPPHPPLDITAMPPARLEHPDTTHPSTSSKASGAPTDTHPPASSSGAPAPPPRKKAPPPMDKAAARPAATAKIPPPFLFFPQTAPLPT